MAIKKFYATKDNTITNQYLENSTTLRATGSNGGQADSLSIFKLYDRLGTSETELARTIIDFDLTEISAARSDGTLPASGSVSFFLNMYNARHPFTVPRDIKLLVHPVSRPWSEGTGVDVDNFTDQDVSNWVSASLAADWTTAGGDYVDGYDKIISLTTGLEDITVDVTDIIEDTLKSLINSYGFGIQLSGTLETDTNNYYIKKFFARSSEYFFKRPTIEARWDSSVKDQRGDFYVSSSMATTENINTIYIYNYFRGELRDVNTLSDTLYVKLFTSASGGTEFDTSNVPSVSYPIEAGKVSTGIYSCSFDFDPGDETYATIYDKWYTFTGVGFPDPVLGAKVFDGSIELKDMAAQGNNKKEPYILNITNLKDTYSRTERDARFRMYVRNKNWSPTVYTVASTDIENTIVEDMYYKVTLLRTNEDVIPYGTGSLQHTLLSYDGQGNYFNFDMSLLEEGNAYGLTFIIKQGSNYYEYPQIFKFRVEE